MRHFPSSVDFRYMIFIGNLALRLSVFVISRFFQPKARFAATAVAQLYLTGMPRVEGNDFVFALKNPGMVAHLSFGIAGNVVRVLSYKYRRLTKYTTPTMGSLLFCLSLYMIWKVLTSKDEARPHDIATVCCLIY